MNTLPVPIEATIDTNNDNIDTTYFQNEAIEKFDFTKTKKENKKQFFLFLIPVVIIITSIIGFSVYSNGIVDSPEIIVPTQTISNEPVAIVSKAKPFYVKVANDVIHAKYIDKNWIVDLGKIQGTTQVQVGGMIDFGFTKLVSNNTKTYTFERDYIAPKTTTDLKSKYDVRDVKYSIILDKPEDNFSIRDNQIIIFETNSKNNNCKIDKDNQLKLNCSMTIEEGKIDSHQIIITDQYGNSSIVGEGTIQLVEANNFDCNQSIIVDEGKIKCKGNKDARVTIAGITQDYKASTEFEASTLLDNGSKKIDINVVDKDELVKNLTYDVVVDKDRLRVDLSSTKFQNSNSAGKIVRANSNKNVTVSLSGNSKSTNKKTGKTTFSSFNYNDVIITNNISANTNTDFYKHYTSSSYMDGCPDCGEFVMELTGYNLTFTADNGKSVSYSCNTAFMCNER
jgi:hypothetical protein